MNIFKKASSTRLRFPTTKGNLSTEDMWEFPLVTLRKMANDINRSIKKDDDLFAVRAPEEDEHKLRLKILVEIIEQRESDKSAAVIALETEQRRQLLRELIAKKKIDKLADSELEDLEKELKSL
jgi:hypothetical protein